jgi:hypothetical protein
MAKGAGDFSRYFRLRVTANFNDQNPVNIQEKKVRLGTILSRDFAGPALQAKTGVFSFRNPLSDLGACHTGIKDSRYTGLRQIVSPPTLRLGGHRTPSKAPHPSHVVYPPHIYAAQNHPSPPETEVSYTRASNQQEVAST